MKEVDYLIVGQGIAGSLLSYFLISKGKSVILVDAYNPSSASRIAAGLINPVTGRRIVKTWKADTIIPFAENIYQRIEQDLGQKFYHKTNILKLFSTYKELNDWMSKSGMPEYQNYILENENNIQTNKSIHDDCGSIQIQHSGFLQMSLFINTYRNYVKA